MLDNKTNDELLADIYLQYADDETVLELAKRLEQAMEREDALVENALAQSQTA